MAWTRARESAPGGSPVGLTVYGSYRIIFFSVPSLKIVKMKRGQNVVAHTLAQYAKTSNQSAVWRFAFPSCVEQLVARDCNSASE